jgi:DNA primase catalytic core
MQIKEAIERINEDIVEIISHFIELKKHGTNYQGLCPFHGEKTPSFVVSPAKGIYKCFGCGKGGDSINFVMEHEKVEFMEAIKLASRKLNLQVDFTQNSRDFDREDYDKKEGIRILNYRVAEFYQNALQNDSTAKEYLKLRNVTIDAHDPYMLGYAPTGNVLLKWANENHIGFSSLKEAGLIGTTDQGQHYDFFRDRIMFPICDKNGKVLAFTGRILVKKENTAKYLNTPETLIFTKSKELFGLNVSRHSIRNQNRAYLVEGNFDVKRLNSIGITNSVAPCGTSLSQDHAIMLKAYTKNVTLIYDGDIAGRAAIDKNGELLVKNQFNVMVLTIPDGQDPDSLFPDLKSFEQFTEEHKPTDFIIYKVLMGMEKCQNPSFKSEFIKDVSSLITRYDEPSLHEVYMDEVSNLLKPKKAWQDAVKSFLADKAPVEKKSYIPKGISADDLRERGFYEEHNCYFFTDSKGTPIQHSNFTMMPLFHVESSINAKRLYKITNTFNLSKVIEIPQKDLVSLSAFQIHVESEGNFWFDGSQSDLNRLKRLLYEKTESCKEIIQLGWQKEGFWAWGNGIFNGKFTEADDYGIIRHHERNYYIPATSKIYASDDNLYHFERRFIHIDSNITLNEYAKKYIKVFGDNAKIALCFYFASLFRDIIVSKFGIFPILNMFGPKGAGKTACAESLVQFFGRLCKAPNVHNTSKPALGEHIASSCNAIAHVDEYRTDIEMEKREFLKGLWDGTGRTKMNMEKDKKKETTPVDQAVVLTGQQMATADIALFSRLIFLSFTQTEYTEAEEQEFLELKSLEKRGLTHITHQILKHRDFFKESFDSHVKQISEIMHKKMDLLVVESRIFNNWLIPLAAYSTLSELIELPWDKNELLNTGISLMLAQNKETKKNDDLGNFWKVIQYLISSSILLDGGDYKVKNCGSIKRIYYDRTQYTHETIPFDEPKLLFYMTTSRVFSLYKSQCLREGEKPLPDSTIEYYLRNSAAFVCETNKESFKKIDPKTNLQEKDEEGVNKRTSSTALIFDLLKTGLSIGDQDNTASESDTGKALPEGTLPF